MSRGLISGQTSNYLTPISTRGGYAYARSLHHAPPIDLTFPEYDGKPEKKAEALHECSEAQIVLAGWAIEFYPKEAAVALADVLEYLGLYQRVPDN